MAESTPDRRAGITGEEAARRAAGDYDRLHARLIASAPTADRAYFAGIHATGVSVLRELSGATFRPLPADDAESVQRYLQTIRALSDGQDLEAMEFWLGLFPDRLTRALAGSLVASRADPDLGRAGSGIGRTSGPAERSVNARATAREEQRLAAPRRGSHVPTAIEREERAEREGRLSTERASE